VTDLAGAGAFGVLVEAVEAAGARGTALPETAPAPPASGVVDATALWVALHGYAALRASVPAFPWPDGLVATLIERLVRRP
jgi:hypothetical protein